MGKNLRRNPTVSVRFGERRIKIVAKLLDYQTDRQLWDEVQAIADRKYGWGDDLPVEITQSCMRLFRLPPKMPHQTTAEEQYD
jgi:hypothetical protein